MGIMSSTQVVRGVTDNSASFLASPIVRSVSAKGGVTKQERRPESQVAMGGAWRAPEFGLGVTSNEYFSGFWRLLEASGIISLRSSFSPDPGEAGGSSQASGVEPGATAAYKVDSGHKGPEAREGQRRTDSPSSPSVTQSVTGIEDNGGSAVEGGDDGKVGVVFSVSSAHIFPGSSGGCCTPLYTHISETAFSSSALDNVSP